MGELASAPVKALQVAGAVRTETAGSRWGGRGREGEGGRAGGQEGGRDSQGCLCHAEARLLGVSTEAVTSFWPHEWDLLRGTVNKTCDVAPYGLARARVGGKLDVHLSRSLPLPLPRTVRGTRDTSLSTGWSEHLPRRLHRPDPLLPRTQRFPVLLGVALGPPPKSCFPASPRGDHTTTLAGTEYVDAGGKLLLSYFEF